MLWPRFRMRWWARPSYYYAGRSLSGATPTVNARERDCASRSSASASTSDGICGLAGGRADERRRSNSSQQCDHPPCAGSSAGPTNLNLVTRGFGLGHGIAPTLIAAPLYSSGKTSLRGMMMPGRVQTRHKDRCAGFVDNFGGARGLGEPCCCGVANFRAALTATSPQATMSEAESSTRRRPRSNGVPEDLEVDSPRGTRGGSRSGKSSSGRQPRADLRSPGRRQDAVFRALSGLWPWGSGRIVGRGGEAGDVCAARHPVPCHVARCVEVLAYPSVSDRFTDGAYVEALQRWASRGTRRASDATQRGSRAQPGRPRWLSRSRG